MSAKGCNPSSSAVRLVCMPRAVTSSGLGHLFGKASMNCRNWFDRACSSGPLHTATEWILSAAGKIHRSSALPRYRVISKILKIAPRASGRFVGGHGRGRPRLQPGIKVVESAAARGSRGWLGLPCAGMTPSRCSVATGLSTVGSADAPSLARPVLSSTHWRRGAARVQPFEHPS